MRVIRYSELAVVPWKNGAGVRRDLFTGEYLGVGNKGSPVATWLIGIADLQQDAPFSSYPGVSRWFMPISAGRLTLMFRVSNSDRPVELNEASPAHYFSGGDELHMLLHEGPMKALNVMTRGRVPKVTMATRRLHDTSQLTWFPNRAGEVRLLLLVHGQCRLSEEGWSVTLLPLDALVGDATSDTGVEVQAYGDCDLVEVLVRWC